MCKLVIKEVKMSEKNKNITCFMVGFQRVFVIIRSDIKNPYNVDLLKIISKYCLLLKEDQSTKFETFKSAIDSIINEHDEINELIENALKIYEVNPITDNLDEIYRYLSVISDTALEVCSQLRQKNFDRAYDLVDAIHCLPEALISKKQWDPKTYWKIYIRPYREKWDKQFLKNQERELLKTSFFKFFRHIC